MSWITLDKMRLTLAFLVLIVLIAVATDAQRSQRRSNARTLAAVTSRRSRAVRTRAGTVRRRAANGSNARRVIVINTGSSTSSSSSRPAARCRTSTTSCSVNRQVCGRWASSRRCHRFMNDCRLERTNCRARGSSWNVVNIGNCSRISVNSTGTCRSTFSSSSSSSSSTSSNLSSILSSILG